MCFLRRQEMIPGFFFIKLNFDIWASFSISHFILSVEQVASKHTVPPVGSSIPTLVSRGLDPLNGAASKRPHSPALEEQAKRLKETEARIHIGWTFNYRTGLAQRQWGRALQGMKHWEDDFMGRLFNVIQPDGPVTTDSILVPVDIGCCQLSRGI